MAKQQFIRKSPITTLKGEGFVNTIRNPHAKGKSTRGHVAVALHDANNTVVYFENKNERDRLQQTYMDKAYHITKAMEQAALRAVEKEANAKPRKEKVRKAAKRPHPDVAVKVYTNDPRQYVDTYPTVVAACAACGFGDPEKVYMYLNKTRVRRTGVKGKFNRRYHVEAVVSENEAK